MQLRMIPLFLMAIPFLRGETVSPLTARGYAVLPIPQKVSLGPRDFALTDGWRLALERGVNGDDVAVHSLTELLGERCGLNLSEKGSGRDGVVRLTVVPNTVAIGDAADKDRTALEPQAYRLVLKPGEISVTANAAPGLFYGVADAGAVVEAARRPLDAAGRRDYRLAGSRPARHLLGRRASPGAPCPF